MLILRYTSAFKRDFRRLQKRSYALAKLRQVLEHLAGDQAQTDQYKDHPLCGKLAGARDLHIEPDWVLVYAIVGGELRLLRTGTHADLFKQ